MKIFVILFLGIVLGAAAGIGVTPVLQTRGWLNWLGPSKKTETPLDKTKAKDPPSDGMNATTEFYQNFDMQEAVDAAWPYGDWYPDPREHKSVLVRAATKEERPGALTRLFCYRDLGHKLQTQDEFDNVCESLEKSVLDKLEEAKVTLVKRRRRGDAEPVWWVSKTKNENGPHYAYYKFGYNTAEIHGDMHLFIHAEPRGAIVVFATLVEQPIESPFRPRQTEITKW